MNDNSSVFLLSATALAICFTMACGDSAGGSAGDGAGVSATSSAIDRDDAATSAWQSSLPASASGVMLGGSAEDRGCKYTVGMAIEAPPFPPQYIAFVQRSGHGHRCALGYVVLGASYARPSVAIASGHGALVADYSAKATPSGEAHTQLFIVQLSPRSGTFVRQTELAAMSPDFQHPQLGNVYDGALQLGHDGTLTVTGNKDGIIPGETGTGDHYVATYEDFLSGPSNPAPTSVMTF